MYSAIHIFQLPCEAAGFVRSHFNIMCSIMTLWIWLPAKMKQIIYPITYKVIFDYYYFFLLLSSQTGLCNKPSSASG